MKTSTFSPPGEPSSEKELRFPSIHCIIAAITLTVTFVINPIYAIANLALIFVPFFIQQRYLWYRQKMLRENVIMLQHENAMRCAILPLAAKLTSEHFSATGCDHRDCQYGVLLQLLCTHLLKK